MSICRLTHCGALLIRFIGLVPFEYMVVSIRSGTPNKTQNDSKRDFGGPTIPQMVALVLGDPHHL